MSEKGRLGESTCRPASLQPGVAQLDGQGGVGALVLARQAQPHGAALLLVVVQLGTHAQSTLGGDRSRQNKSKGKAAGADRGADTHSGLPGPLSQHRHGVLGLLDREGWSSWLNTSQSGD